MLGRLWVGAALVVVLVAVGVAVVLTFGGERRTTRLAWRLGSVSADARTIGVVHEGPGCAEQLDAVRVVERARSVSIAISEHSIKVHHVVYCGAVLSSAVSRVRLRSPLGTRRLVQPAGGHGDRALLAAAGGFQSRLCDAYRRLPARVAARDVPWVAHRVRVCSEPVPRALRALAILRRHASSADRLPSIVRFTAQRSPVVSRLDLARGVRSPERMWLIPGPRQSCLSAVFSRFGEGYLRICEPSTRVARRGIYLARPCVTVPAAPHERRSLVGVVPADITHVTLRRNSRVVGRAHATDGLWAATSRQPDEISYAHTRLRVEREHARCE